MYYWLYWYRVHLYHRRESNSQTWVIATDVNTIQYNRSNDGQLSQNAQNPSVEICFHTTQSKIINWTSSQRQLKYNGILSMS